MKPKFQTDKTFRQCVGIDVSKETLTVCLCMLSWGTPAQCTESIDFANSKTGFNQLIKWARKEAEKAHPIAFVMEPTGSYYEELAFHLHKLSFPVYVVPTGRVHAFFKSEGFKTKTDKVDARGLALMGCCKQNLTPWNPPSPIYKELRQLTRLGIQMKNMHTMAGNIHEGLSHQHAPSSEAMKQIRTLLKSLEDKIDKNLQSIIELAKHSEEISEKLTYIESIKGIGFLTAITILAETDGFSNIFNRSQLASFAGLDVVARESGSSSPARHISKKGNTHIRRIVFNCALSAIRYNPQMTALYTRISQHRPSMVARTAVMRKLLLLSYTLCKNKTTYDHTK